MFHRIALALALLFVIARPARADVLEDLEAASNEQRISDMLALGKQAVVQHPKKLEAHLWYGVANLWVSDMTLAETHLKKALELDPKQAVVHYYLHNFYYTKGDFAAAKAEFQKVNELEPNGELFEDIAMAQQIFATPTAESPEGKLLIEMIEAMRKNGLSSVAESLHPDFRQQIRDALGTDDLSSPAFAQGFLKGVGDDPEWVGYAVKDSERVSATRGAKWLSVEAALRVTLSERKVETFANLFETNKELAQPDMAWVYENLNATDRKLYLERMKGQRIVSYIDAEVMLAPAGGKLKISDIVISGTVSMRDSLPKIAPAVEQIEASKDGAGKPRQNLSRRIGQILGTILGLVAAGFLARWLMKRRA